MVKSELDYIAATHRPRALKGHLGSFDSDHILISALIDKEHLSFSNRERNTKKKIVLRQ